MELVKGIPIAEYCDKNNLSTKDRLDLFMPICHAIQHAHQKGIIHRDIKPSRHVDAPRRQAGAQGDRLRDRQSHGSQNLKTLREAVYGEIQRIIREVDPPTPSSRLSTLGDELTEIAKHRHADPKTLSKTIRGDLDWIVMKALEKDRTRRYETANELAKDVEHHLANEPVLAGRPGMANQLHKFVKRNRVAVTAGSLVAAALVIGLIVSMVGFVQASRQRDRAVIAEQQQSSERERAETARTAEAEQRRLAESERDREKLCN